MKKGSNKEITFTLKEIEAAKKKLLAIAKTGGPVPRKGTKLRAFLDALTTPPAA